MEMGGELGKGFYDVLRIGGGEVEDWGIWVGGGRRGSR